MPNEAYKESHENFAMPPPIPKSSSIEDKDDLRYMSLEDAGKQPFTDKHQSSLILRRRINNVASGEVSIGERESRSTEPETQNK
jgi:hypothetical protein